MGGDRSSSDHERWAAPTLVGSLVTLRQLAADDADAVWEMVNDAEGNDLTATTESFTRDQIDDWCRTRVDQDERLDLAIVDNETGVFVGEAVLNDFDAATDSCDFRISLRGPEWYGRGFGTDATRLITDHGLDVMGLAWISLEVLGRNPRARAVYDKIGFTEVGTYEEDGETWIRMRMAR